MIKIPCWSLALVLALASTASAQTARKNVLFIVVDDLRPEFGAYGSDVVFSPNMDALAQRGMRFDRAYCQQAVCSPSRSSVMTGARPDTTQVYDLVTHFRTAMPNVVTLGQHFKNKGYYTTAIGKVYHGELQDDPTWTDPAVIIGGGPYALQASKDEKRDTGKGPAFESAPNVWDTAYEDGQTAKAAVELLEDLHQNNPQQPFFLAVGFGKPHLPFAAPKRYWDYYVPAIDIDLPVAPNTDLPDEAPIYAIKKGSELFNNYSGLGDSLSAEQARQLKHGYYAAISFVDDQIGKVLNQLDALGLRNNTIVVLWGDHGYKLGEHGAWTKHSNCENDTRAPLIIAAPGLVAPGTSTKKIVEFVDIYPTLIDLANLPGPKPAHLEGLSFKPLIDNPSITWKQAAFSQFPREYIPEGQQNKKFLMGYSMRTARYRFTDWINIGNPSEIDGTELYDHQTDPEENYNLALDPTKVGLINVLRTKLNEGWQGALPPAP